MKHLDYENWAEYIVDLSEIYLSDTSNVLELGAGRGYISNYLKNEFGCYIISDSSFAMLSQNEKIENLCVCDMSSLPFNKEFDLIFSIFDSVNYLITPNIFIKFLSECRDLLDPMGILTFDVSLESNSRANIKGLNRKGFYKGIKYKQISSYDENTRIHKNIVEMIIKDEHFIETHFQHIYKFEDYFEFAEKANMKILDAYECFSFDDATHKSERVQFVLGKV
ncbi:MAG: class I SAM-dependent methyltransferase [Melioribacteraceae bacterium]|nr:class I SAM-dependent methyltransferase [Melioribacteraceae bacterium]